MAGCVRLQLATVLLFVTVALGAVASAGEPSLENALPSTSAVVQADATRLARARRLLPASAVANVLNGFVVPHWIGSSDEFWYRHETATGHEFVIVDAATGRRRPAFDAAALASALRAAGVDPIDPSRLALDGLEIHASRLSFATGGRRFTCERAATGVRCDPERAPAAAPGLLLAPNGRMGAFTRGGNLWLRDVGTGAERALTTDGEDGWSYGTGPDADTARVAAQRSGTPSRPVLTYWSPDSTRLVVARVDQRHLRPYPYVEHVPRDGSVRPRLYQFRVALYGEKPFELSWYVMDVAGGAPRRIVFPHDVELGGPLLPAPNHRFWFSPDGRRIHSYFDGRYLSAGYLFETDATTGATRAVVEERGAWRYVPNTSLYSAPNVRVLGGGSEAIWFSERDGWGHLYLYDLRTGRLKNRITDGPWVVRDVVHVDEKRRHVYFTAGGREPGNPYLRYLYRASLDGGGLTLLTAEQGDHLIANSEAVLRGFDGARPYRAISPSGRYVVYNVSTVDRPSETLIRRTRDGRRVATVARADASRFLADGYRPPEEFVVKAADGTTDLYGVMFKPADFDPLKKYAVIDAQYASPFTPVAPRNWLTATQLSIDVFPPGATAALGFVVVVVDARGTPQRSREFSQTPKGYLSRMGLDDHVAALRQLAAREPALDLGHLGIAGTSFGGWTAIRALEEFPDVFKFGYAAAAPGSFDTLYESDLVAPFQGPPMFANGTHLRSTDADRPTNWMDIDATKDIGKIRGRLLMTIGELDENVLPTSSLQFVDAAMRADVNVDWIYVPGGTHGAAYTPSIQRRVWAYFVKHLQGTDLPDDFRLPPGPGF